MPTHALQQNLRLFDSLQRARSAFSPWLKYSTGAHPQWVRRTTLPSSGAGVCLCRLQKHYSAAWRIALLRPLIFTFWGTNPRAWFGAHMATRRALPQLRFFAGAAALLWASQVAAEGNLDNFSGVQAAPEGAALELAPAIHGGRFPRLGCPSQMRHRAS